MVETVKRILAKERIDRKLAWQTSLTPSMSIKEGFGKKVTFNMIDGIEQKIEKWMVMMGKLVMEDEDRTDPKQAEVRLDAITIREDFKIGSD